jgi:CheY-like chemotaxis protein
VPGQTFLSPLVTLLAALIAIQASQPGPTPGSAYRSIRIEEGENMAVILVADDEEMVRIFASTVLRKAGHDVLAARNGFEAVKLYRSSRRPIDLVITDITMPVMDGPQAVRLIRAAQPGARIICMSGNGGTECPPGAFFLPKPFTPDALCASVTELLMPSKAVGLA